MPLRESLTYDEADYFNGGVAFLSGKPSEDKNPTGMPAQALYPLINKAIRKAIPDRIISKSVKASERIYLGKLATISVSLILASYIFLWTRQLYGINAGFLALSLYLLDPNIIAHSRIVHQNIFEACAIFIATYYFWKFLKFGGRKNAVLSIITFGIAQITRYTAVYLLPIYLLLTFGFYSSRIFNLIKTNQFKIIFSAIKQFCTYTLLFLFTAILIINIGFSFEKTFTKLGDYKFESSTFTSLQSSSPLLRALPVPVPYAYLRGLDFGKFKQEAGAGSGRPYLMGLLSTQKKGFKRYYIMAFLYKVPIATQLILFMAVISLIKYRHQIKFWQNEAFLIIPTLVFFIAFSLTNAQLGIRYILMIFPFLFVLSSRIAIGWEASKTRYRILVTNLLAYLLISNLSYFPHYISYFNELLVDRKMGYTILADSNLDWGQNENYLRNYLQKNPDTMYTSKSIGNLELRADRVFDSEHPQTGLVLIGTNDLTGIVGDPNLFKWIRKNLKPVEHVAYSHLVFKIQPQNLEPIRKSLTARQ